MKPQPYFYFSTNLLAGHSWKFMLAQGIISILLGIIFALNFGSALLIFAILLGIMLLGCGVQGFALMALNRKFKIGYALYSLFWFIAGLFLVIDPLMGASFLMIVLGIWFVLHAIELFTAALADKLHPVGFRWLVALNGDRIFQPAVRVFPDLLRSDHDRCSDEIPQNRQGGEGGNGGGNGITIR